LPVGKKSLRYNGFFINLTINR